MSCTGMVRSDITYCVIIDRSDRDGLEIPLYY